MDKLDKLIMLKSDKYILQKFIKNIMVHGKKTTAFKIFSNVLIEIKNKTKENPYDVLDKAFKNVKPPVELKKIVVAGISYRIPILVSDERSIALAIKWLVFYARKRSEYKFQDKLVNEIIDASNNTGLTIKYKNELNKIAVLNRPYLKYMR